MLGILGWIIYFLIIGALARIIHPGSDPEGCLATVLIGIAGSLVGRRFNQRSK